MADASNELSNHNNLGAACFRCRGFRHACDRQKPVCSRCQRRGINCTYPEAAPTLKKLQKATETLGDRIRKFGDRLKSAETMPKELKGISLQCLAQRSATPGSEVETPSIMSEHSDNRSSISVASDTTSERDEDMRPRPPSVASTSSFSIYPCGKCYKDLQQCDLTMPRCGRCTDNGTECTYMKTEPKANHVSQVLTTMNKVMDQWQESIDKIAKDFAQKTRDFSARANNSLKIKPLPPFAWKITSTGKGLSVESTVNSYGDLSKLVDQFKRSMHITPREPIPQPASSPPMSDERQRLAREAELDDTSSIHTSSGFSFAVWNTWSHPTYALPQDYPIDISTELTDDLIELYCRTPCCSSIRLPIIDVVDFMKRYRDPDPEKRPSTVLVYAICSMAARNAFQLHVWSKRPSHESPQYNMGKVLSIAYSLKGRELLSECFDEPSIDNCQAAFLLSYSNHQNGYPGVIYIYEWIAFTMAQELGLYDHGRELSRQESILVWCLYYFNTWYRVLQGNSSTTSVESSQFYPHCPLPPPLPKPSEDDMNPGSEKEIFQGTVDYYIWSVWYYLIKLQVLRHDVMTRLLAAQTTGKADVNLPLDLLAMQDRLEQFHDDLPPEWQDPNLHFVANESISRASESQEAHDDHKHYHLDIKEFAKFCILNVNVHYNINKILLYQPFFPSDHMPTSEFSLYCLETSIDSAYFITHSVEIMVKYRDDCNIPLAGLLFSNIVYNKLLKYKDDKYRDFAVRCMQRSLDISKISTGYAYDFEMAKNLVHVMDQEVRSVCGPLASRSGSIDSFDSSVPSSTLTSLPSPPHHPPIDHQLPQNLSPSPFHSTY
ncbi:Zn(2)-C6 fungal-specific transcription factor [Phycomyces blakesleeanus]|uniref:Zn(2)-C6 fungal-specific transcription factor n=1 Tax=Phycomyces blakesleeanus TaxID=4837 RepID=A0ABR3BDL7_PHYBL